MTSPPFFGHLMSSVSYNPTELSDESPCFECVSEYYFIEVGVLFRRVEWFALSRIIGDTMDHTGLSSKHFSYVLHVEVAVVRQKLRI